MNRQAEKRYFARKCTDKMPVPRTNTMSFVEHHKKEREHKLHNFVPYGNGKRWKHCNDCGAIKKI